MSWANLAQDYGKSVPGFTKQEFESLLWFGVYAQNATYRNLTMPKVVDVLLASFQNQSNQTFDLSKALHKGGFPADSAEQTLMTLKLLLEELLRSFATTPRTAMVISVLSLLTFAGTPFVALRFYARYYIAKNVRLDDWLILLAQVITIGFGIKIIMSEICGYLDYHIWMLTFENLVTYQYHVFLSEMLYVLSLYSVKLSFIAFYYNLMPQRLWRFSVMVIFWVNTVAQILCLILLIFQCKKLDWWNDPLTDKCLNREYLIISIASLSAFSDIVLLLLPIPAVLRLKLKRREKAMIIGVFGLGGIICVAAIVKILTTNGFFYDVDISSKGIGTGVFCLLEITLAIIVSCVPTLKPIFKSKRSRNSAVEGMPQRSWIHRRGPRPIKQSLTLSTFGTSNFTSTTATELKEDDSGNNNDNVVLIGRGDNNRDFEPESNHSTQIGTKKGCD